MTTPTHPAVTTERTTIKDCFVALCMVAVIGIMAWLAIWATTGGSEQSGEKPCYGFTSCDLRVDWSGFPVASPVAFPSRMEMVMIEPTPTATSVVPTKVPTQSPFLCPDNPNTLPNGETCLGPPAPLPTPLPMPTCQATPVPGVVCVVRDSVIQE